MEEPTVTTDQRAILLLTVLGLLLLAGLFLAAQTELIAP
jgi:hypothetical protein